MDTLLLFGTTLIGIFLAFSTCELLAKRLTPVGRTIDLHSGYRSAAGVLGVWALTDLVAWEWGPQALLRQLDTATPVEVSIVSMLIILWVVLPSFVLGLALQRIRHAIHSQKAAAKEQR